LSSARAELIQTSGSYGLARERSPALAAADARAASFRTCADCREADPYPDDDVEAARLWRYSAELTGRDLPVR
jgi:hypothetical protein